jgi:hypothetical protein
MSHSQGIAGLPGHPRMARYENIEVHPYYQLFAPTIGDLRGGPRWPDFATRTFERHSRFGRAIDLDVGDGPTPTLRLSGRHVWLGPVVGHFGHQMLDFSTRAAAAALLEPTAKFLVAAQAPIDDPRAQPSGNDWRYASVNTIPEYVRGILAWNGVPLERLVLVTEPVTVEELVVTEQGEQFQVAPAPWQLDALSQCAARQGSRPGGPIYVSRTQLTSPLGNVMGESVIEQAFERAGYRIVHPEQLPVFAQGRIYAGAERLVFSEGSAMHGIGLLGRVDAPVTIIDRRRGGDAHTFECSLAPRVESYTRICAVEDSYPDDQHWRAVSVLNPEEFLAQAHDCGLDLAGTFDPRDYWRAAADDLTRVDGIVRARPAAFGMAKDEFETGLGARMTADVAELRLKGQSG